MVCQNSALGVFLNATFAPCEAIMPHTTFQLAAPVARYKELIR